jgi:hypothetical protein
VGLLWPKSKSRYLHSQHLGSLIFRKIEEYLVSNLHLRAAGVVKENVAAPKLKEQPQLIGEAVGEGSSAKMTGDVLLVTTKSLSA